MHGGTIEQRASMHARGARRVLDQLDQRVAEHHAARRDGKVAADRERARVAPRDVTALRVGCEIGEALHEARAFGIERALQHDGVGRDEVGRRERVDELLRREDEALLLRLRERGRCGELVQIFGWRAGSSASSARRTGARSTPAPQIAGRPAGLRRRRESARARSCASASVAALHSAAHRFPYSSLSRASASACEKPAAVALAAAVGPCGRAVPRRREVRAGPPPRPVADSRLPAFGKLCRRMRLACRGRGHGAGLPGGERGGRARRNVRSRFIIRMTRVELL